MNQRFLETLYIKNKSGQKVRFTPNRAQRDYGKHRTGRDLILKARQLGFTTYEQLRKLERVLLKPNITSCTLAHQFGKTQDIFMITKYAWDNLSEDFKGFYKIRYDSAKELFFSNTNSRYFVDMNVRSGTVQDLHISEVAFIKDMEEIFAASFEAVPKGGSITLETTANGLNTFADLWNDTVQGKTEFTPHFYNWTWDIDYYTNPPEDSRWKEDYKVLAKKYNLISDIQEAHNLTDEQFYWYYEKAIRLKEQVKQEYPTVPEEAFLSSSISVFNLYEVAQLKLPEPIRQARGIRIFREPEVNHKYIIGCDTSEGLGGDRTTMQCWDFTNENKLVQVASFQDANIRPDQVADLLIYLGKMYNNAFLIPERNSSGLTTVIKLQESGYRNLFVNTTIDKKTAQRKNEYGWRTTASNRDVMVDDFIEYFEEGKLEINDVETVQEMKTFVRKKNGFREHEDGYHDDNLFANFLAIQGRKYYRDIKFQSFPRGMLGI